MDQPEPRKPLPVPDYSNYSTDRGTGFMRAIGRLVIPALGLLGVGMLALGIIDRNYQSLAIAGSVLIGAILVALSLPNRR